MRSFILALSLGTIAALPACKDMDPSGLPLPMFARGGPGGDRLPLIVTIHDGADLINDGAATYADGVCGVSAWMDGLAFMNPTANRISVKDKPACGDGRSAQLILDGIPHDLSNLKVNPVGGWDNPTIATGTINVWACAFVSGNKASGLGLRFDPQNFPGTDYLSVTTLEPGRSWRVTSQPAPNNRAYCDGDHYNAQIVNVNVDLTVELN